MIFNANLGGCIPFTLNFSLELNILSQFLCWNYSINFHFYIISPDGVINPYLSMRKEKGEACVSSSINTSKEIMNVGEKNTDSQYSSRFLIKSINYKTEFASNQKT